MQTVAPPTSNAIVTSNENWLANRHPNPSDIVPCMGPPQRLQVPFLDPSIAMLALINKTRSSTKTQGSLDVYRPLSLGVLVGRKTTFRPPVMAEE